MADGYKVNEEHFGKDNLELAPISDLENTYDIMKPSERKFILKLNAFMYLTSTIALFISVLLAKMEKEYNICNIFNMFSKFGDGNKFYTTSGQQVTVFWCILLMIQGLFAFLPLIYTRENFISVCCTHIGFHFAICQMALIIFICLLFLKSLYSTNKWYLTLIPAMYLLGMKIHVLICIYSRVKYLDEGQDYVGFTEFTCIHANFAIYSCMLSYLFLVFIISVYSELIHEDASLTIEGAQNYRLIICVVLILESWVNMAKYKDLVSGLSISQILAGIYSNFFFNKSNSEHKDIKELLGEQNKVLVCIVISEIISVVITFAYHHKSSVYIKYKDWAEMIYGANKRKGIIERHMHFVVKTKLQHKIEKLFDSNSKYSVTTDSSFDRMSIITNS